MQPLLMCVTAFGLFSSLACAGQREETSTRTDVSRDCTRAALSQLLATDTTRLTRTDYEDLEPESSEGMILTAYTDNADPRVVVATYFGEMGKTVDRYYIASAEDFVVERVTIHYARPIYQQAIPEIISQERAVIYFCEKRPLEEPEGVPATFLFQSLARFLNEIESRAEQ